MAALNSPGTGRRAQIGAVALMLAAAGCSPSPWKLLTSGAETADLLQSAASPDRVQPPAIKGMNLPACASGRLANPVFELYIAARIAGQSRVPAYRTEFHLYPPPTPWALPEEQTATAFCAGDAVP